MKGIEFCGGKIGYVFVPKVACTSVKSAIFKLENGRDYDVNVDSGKHIHNYFRSKFVDIDLCVHRVLLVRDPIKRLISAHGNRVVHHKELSYENIKFTNPEIADDFDIYNPGIGQFIYDFERYYRVDSIKHHTRPISEIIDNNYVFFNHVFPIEKIKFFEILVSRVSGKHFGLTREQTGGKKVQIHDLTERQLEVLFHFYSEDYRMLKDFYSIDKIWHAWKQHR